jgi:hypothetical protein
LLGREFPRRAVQEGELAGEGRFDPHPRQEHLAADVRAIGQGLEFRQFGGHAAGQGALFGRPPAGVIRAAFGQGH